MIYLYLLFVTLFPFLAFYLPFDVLSGTLFDLSSLQRKEKDWRTDPVFDNVGKLSGRHLLHHLTFILSCDR